MARRSLASRYERPGFNYWPIVLFLLVAGLGGSFFLWRDHRPIEAPNASPNPNGPVAPPTATSPAMPVATPLSRRAQELSDEDIAERIAKGRMRDLWPGSSEVMSDESARGFYEAFKAQALDEIKLGRHAIAWGKQHGKRDEACEHVFIELVDAAHRGNTTDPEVFSDEIIAQLYAREERFERATSK